MKKEEDAEFLLKALFQSYNLESITIDNLKIREKCEYKMLKRRISNPSELPILPKSLQFLKITNSDSFFSLFVKQSFTNSHKLCFKSSQFVEYLYPDGIIIKWITNFKNINL